MRIIEQLVYKIIGDTKGLDKSIDGSDKKVDGFSGRLGSLGKMLTVGAVAVGLVAVTKKLYSMATESAAATDRIDKMSQKIGISAEAFQEWDFILSQSGASVDGLQTGLKTLSRAADEASQGTAEYAEAFDRLGVSVTDSNGKLKSQEALFTEVFEALAEVEGETERTAIATQLLGRSATELAPALNAGKDGIEDMRAQAHELGLVLDDTTIKAGVDLTDAVDRLERKFESMKNRALTPVVAGLADVIDKISGTKTPLADMNEILGKLEQNGKDYATALADVETNTDGVKDATLELLSAQRQQLLYDLEKAYLGAGRQLDKYSEQLEKNKKINIDSNATLDNLANSLGLKRDELRQAANEERLSGIALQLYNQEVLKITNSWDKYREAQIELAKIEQDKQRFISASVEAYIAEGVSVERIKDLDLELYNEIARLIEARKIQITSEKGLQDQLHGTSLDQIDVTAATKGATEATEEATEAIEGLGISIGNVNADWNTALDVIGKLTPETMALVEQEIAAKEALEALARAHGGYQYATAESKAQTVDLTAGLGEYAGGLDAAVASTYVADLALHGLIDTVIYGTEEVKASKTAFQEWAESNADGIRNSFMGLSLLTSAWDRLNQTQENQNEEQLNRLKDQNAAVIESLEEQGASYEEIQETKKSQDAEYDDLKRQYATEELKRSKSQASFQAIIDTASAIIGFLADPGGIPGAALSIAAGVTGLAQISAIQSQPIPSFDVGSIRIPETTTAVVHKDEMILTAPQAEQARREGISIGPSGGSGGEAVLMVDGVKLGKIIWNHANGGRLGVLDKRVVK